MFEYIHTFEKEKGKRTYSNNLTNVDFTFFILYDDNNNNNNNNNNNKQ